MTARDNGIRIMHRQTRRWIALGAFGAAICLLPLAARPPYANIIMSAAVFIGINALIVAGLNLLMGYAGQVSLGHAAFAGIGAYSSAILTVRFGLDPWLAMAAGVAAACAIAWLIGIPTLRLHGHYLAIATLGFGVIVSITFVEWRSLTGGVGGIPDVPALRIGGFAITGHVRAYYVVWAFVFAAMVGTANLVDSRAGRALRAIRGSELAAGTAGINTARYKLQVFVLSAALAAVGGSLFVHYIRFVSPTRFGFGYSIELVVMAVLGGLGNVWGPVVGAGLITVLGEILRGLRDLDVPAFGLILVLVLIFLPRGVTNSLGLLWQRRGAPRARGQEAPESSAVGPGEA